MSSIRDELITQLSDIFSVPAEYLFEGDESTAVFRRGDNHKWFGIVMTIPARKLGLSRDGSVDVINVKGEPLFISVLHSQPGFYPAWHMNKQHWLTILLDGTVPLTQVLDLADMSYALTAPKAKRIASKEE